MIDVSKLSDKELSELRKAVLAESSNRGEKLKSYACVYGKLLEMGLEEQLTKEGLVRYTSNDKKNNWAANTAIASVEKAIYKVCDIILGNYKIIHDADYRVNDMTATKIICNGAKLYDECYENYMEMSSEIIDVCKKYFDKSKEYREKKDGKNE